jgi:hypothetical protein
LRFKSKSGVTIELEIVAKHDGHLTPELGPSPKTAAGLPETTP